MYLIMPCTPNNWIVPDGWMPEFEMLVDEKHVGTITQCAHRTLKVASGKRSIYAKSKTWFGLGSNVQYPIAPNSELYLRATYEYGNPRFFEVSPENGRANMGRIDRRELL